MLHRKEIHRGGPIDFTVYLLRHLMIHKLHGAKGQEAKQNIKLNRIKSKQRFLQSCCAAEIKY